jgi:NADH dehydrogenase [ubiquinone] 1 alpha subcomplex assembly factor 1
MRFAFLLFLLFSQTAMDINFGTESGGSDWRATNDGVMGGRSEGRLSMRENSIFFEGYVSLENNGGFASFNGPYQDMDLSAYQSVSIRYRSKGQAFSMALAKDRRWWIPNYKYKLKENTEGWEVATFQLMDFKEYYMGEPTGNAIQESLLEDIIRMGFIAYNKKAGAFEFEIDYIRFD